jgi:histidine transport system substrate-binding protein
MIGSRTDLVTHRVAIISWTHDQCPRLPLGFLFVVLALLSACARPSDDAWDRMRETGVLRVGMDASFPPFETIAADGTLVGFDVDLAREVGRRLGVEVQFVANLPYDGLYDALVAGHVDAVISALVINSARMADFAYSTPYFDAGQVLVAADRAGRRDEQRGGGGQALDGCTLAVEFGSRGDLEARKWARRLQDLTVVPCQTATDALAQVATGEADYALVDHVSALVGVQHYEAMPSPEATGLFIAGEPVVEEPYAVAVHRESQHLLRAINDALAEMEADGSMDALATTWLSPP